MGEQVFSHRLTITFVNFFAVCGMAMLFTSAVPGYCPYTNPCEGITCQNKSHICIPNQEKCSYACQPECIESSTCDDVGRSLACTEDKCLEGECFISPCSCQPACEISRACVNECYNVYIPVCGSNGKTYDNICELKHASCKNKWHLNLKYLGSCGCEVTFCETNPCNTTVCKPEEKCFPDFCSDGCFGVCLSWY